MENIEKYQNYYGFAKVSTGGAIVGFFNFVFALLLAAITFIIYLYLGAIVGGEPFSSLTSKDRFLTEDFYFDLGVLAVLISLVSHALMSLTLVAVSIRATKSDTLLQRSHKVLEFLLVTHAIFLALSILLMLVCIYLLWIVVSIFIVVFALAVACQLQKIIMMRALIEGNKEFQLLAA